MKITRTSPYSGKEHTFDMPICQPQIERIEAGRALHLALANLEPWELEFYKTGRTPDDFERMAGVPAFDPGDRVVHEDGEHGYVMQVREDLEILSYVVKFDTQDLPSNAVPETKLTKEKS